MEIKPNERKDNCAHNIGNYCIESGDEKINIKKNCLSCKFFMKKNEY